MYKFCVLYSGSTGNATYIGTKKEGILIDAGKNAKQLCLALSNCGIKPEAVKAVFLTHEHIDHIGAIRVFCNRFNIPVYASLNTLEVLDFNGHLNGDFDVFQMQGLADIGDFHIESFHTMHDVTESFGFNVFLPNGIKTSVITDLGVVTEEVEEAILESKVILLESNHDESMLLTGPYPYSLKRRIMSERGHLSNDAAAEIAVKLIKSGTEHIILGHLSAENNFPSLAYATTKEKLTLFDAVENEDYTLTIASRHEQREIEIS